MKIKTLQEFFEKEDFQVHLFKQDKKQCAEVETWTNGGVNMIIVLQPFIKEQFVEYVEQFNIDDEIDMCRQDQRYKAVFTITESVKDFTDFHNRLKEVEKKLNLPKES
jgi:hypothetical protein